MANLGSPARSNANTAQLGGRAAIYWSQSSPLGHLARRLVGTATLVLFVVGVTGSLRAAPASTATPGVPGMSAQMTQDLNGDGKVDAVFTQKQRFNQVCFGNGTGAFTTCTNLVGAGTNQLSDQINTTDSALVDWDRDGDLDIVLAFEGHANVVCHNDGGGGFNSGVGCVALFDYNSFPFNSQDVAVGDISGDGHPDLVFANGGNAGLPLAQDNVMCLGLENGLAACYSVGYANGGSAAASTGVALGDADGDGDQDILTANSGSLNEVCLNQGLTFGIPVFDCRAIPKAGTVSATKVSNAVAVGHLPNGFGVAPDGFLDVVFGNTGQNERCFGNGDWSGTNVGLACGGVNPVTTYTLTDAAARTTDVIIANIRPGTSGAFVGDEIIFVNEDAPNLWCFGAFTCTTGFNQSETVSWNGFMVSEPVVEATTGVAIQDINIDGHVDVVVANTGALGGVSRMYPGLAYSPSVIARSGLRPTSVTLSGGTVGPSLVDEDPPVISGATNITREATGPTGAVAHFAPLAVDVVDGPVAVTCAPASASVFALGDTTVSCTATDAAGNNGTASFVVSIVDTTAPAVVVPADMVVYAPAGQTSTAVTFQASAFDLVDGVVEEFCFVNTSGVFSGDQFAGGSRTVHCGAYDTRKNYGQSSFSLTVRTDIDSDGTLDDEDTDDDGDGIADTVDTQPTVYSNEYRFDATNTGTITRNGWTVSIRPAAGGVYDLRATVSGSGNAPAIVPAYCGYVRKELRFDATGESIDWRCIAGGHASTNSLAVNFLAGTVEFWKASAGVWTRITATPGGTAASAGSPVIADPANTAPVLVTLFNELLEEIGSFGLEPGESVDVDTVEVDGEQVLQLELLNGGPDGIVHVTLFGQAVALQGGGPVTFDLNPDLSAPVIAAQVSGTAGTNGYYTSDVTVTWTVTDPESAATSSGCDTQTVTQDTAGVTFTCSAQSEGGSSSQTVTIKRDATAPVITYSGNAGTYQAADTVNITCAVSDASGVATTTCATIAGPATSFQTGTNTVTSTATDVAGNTATASVTFTVVAAASLEDRIRQIAGNSADQLIHAALNVAKAPNANAREGRLNAYRNQVNAQLRSGKINATQAARLIALVN